MDNLDVVYTAGLFDGEGSVVLGFYRSQKNGKRYARLRAKITSTDREVLEWVAGVFGSGRVHSKSDRRNIRNRPCYDVHFNTAAARRFLKLILPYLRIKRELVEEIVLKELKLVKPRKAA